MCLWYAQLGTSLSLLYLSCSRQALHVMLPQARVQPLCFMAVDRVGHMREVLTGGVSWDFTAHNGLEGLRVGGWVGVWKAPGQIQAAPLPLGVCVRVLAARFHPSICELASAAICTPACRVARAASVARTFIIAQLLLQLPPWLQQLLPDWLTRDTQFPNAAESRTVLLYSVCPFPAVDWLKPCCQRCCARRWRQGVAYGIMHRALCSE